MTRGAKPHNPGEHKKLISVYVRPWIAERLKQDSKKGVSQGMQIEQALLKLWNNAEHN
jgi:hypothetical protein